MSGDSTVVIDNLHRALEGFLASCAPVQSPPADEADVFAVAKWTLENLSYCHDHAVAKWTAVFDVSAERCEVLLGSGRLSAGGADRMRCLLLIIAPASLMAQKACLPCGSEESLAATLTPGQSYVGKLLTHYFGTRGETHVPLNSTIGGPDRGPVAVRGDTASPSSAPGIVTEGSGESCQQKEYTTNAVSPLWYAGKISAREAEAMLANKIDGTYMIRESTSQAGSHNLTVRNNNMVYHYRFQRSPSGQVFIQEGDAFDSIWEFVEHHKGSIYKVGAFTMQLQFAIYAYASNPWYHGDITKEGAENMLSKAPNGSFLVRHSTGDEQNLTLSLRAAVAHVESLLHYRIAQFPDGTYALSPDLKFPTLEKLIGFYAKEVGSSGSIPALRKALTRHPRAHVDMTTGNAIYTYLNLSAKAQALAVGPNGVLGSGFGNAGLYQRRWLNSVLRSSTVRQQSL